MYKYCSAILIFYLLFARPLKADIVEVQKEQKQFGDWLVLCETDLMMNMSNCKIAAKFYNQTSVITIEPSTMINSHIILIIPQVKNGSMVKIKVDKNDLIFSNQAKPSGFGFISLDQKQKSLLLQQMEKGDFLFIRFNSRDSEQEITARLNLKDFRKSVSYYNNKINN